MNDWLLGTDWGGYWSGVSRFNFTDLISRAGLGFFVTKGAETNEAAGYSSVKNLEISRQYLSLNGSYYWLYPQQSVAYMLSWILPAIDREKPDFIYIDMEEYMPYGGGTIYDPQLISDRCQGLWEELSTRYPEKVVDVYTSSSFVKYYALPFTEWSDKLTSPWIAAWPDYGLKPYEKTYEQIANGEMRYCTNWQASEPRPYVEINTLDGNWGPDLTYWPNAKHFIWQYSSRVMPKGLTYPYYHQYDWNRFSGNLQEMQTWAKKETTIEMAGMYDINVPQAQRATVLTLTDTQAHANIQTLSDGGTDVFALNIGGMEGSAPNYLYEDSAWRIRVPQVAAVKKPIIGMFALNAYYHPNIKQRTSTQVETMPIEDNEVLRRIIGSLRTDSNWTYNTISATDGKWLPVNALMFVFWVSNYPNGTPIGGDWQRRTLQNLLDPILSFEDKGKMPKLQIIIFGSPDFFNKYQGSELTNYLQTQRNRISMAWSQHYFASAPTATVLSTTEAWSYRIPDDYKLNNTVYGFNSDPNNTNDNGHIVYHEASSNRFLIETITDSLGKPVPANTGFGYTTKDEFYKFLNFTGAVEPPPIEPPVEPPITDLEARVVILESDILVLKNQINTLTSQQTKVDNWIKGYNA